MKLTSAAIVVEASTAWSSMALAAAGGYIPGRTTIVSSHVLNVTRDYYYTNSK